MATLADYQRGILRNGIRAAFDEGSARRLVIPWAAIPSVILPALYLSIPQPAGTRQRVLSWITAAVVVALHVDLVRSLVDGVRTSSLNVAFGYGVGVSAAWGSMWALVVLVWKDVQRDAARVARRPRRAAPGNTPGPAASSDGTSTGLSNGSGSKLGLSLRSRSNGATSNGSPRQATPPSSAASPAPFVVDTDVTRSLETHEYYWQPFPASASFVVRFLWALDLCLAWRGVGWNFCVSQVPHFPRPHLGGSAAAASVSGARDAKDATPASNAAVALSMPLVSPAGYRRYPTYLSFFAGRLLAVAAGYLVLDACAVAMTFDPFFVLGPAPQPYLPWSAQIDHYPTTSYLYPQGQPNHPPPPAALFAMPPWLEQLYRQSPPIVLHAYRSLLGAAGMFSALAMILSGVQILQLLLLGHSNPLRLLFLFSPSTPYIGVAGGELWAYPTLFGSFTRVLDQGLAGFWGEAWHQSFRLGFVAPTQWLRRRGFLPGKEGLPGRLVTLLLAFGQSGLIHAAAHVTALSGRGAWYRPMVFFLLAGVGLAVEDALAGVLQSVVGTRKVPRALRATGNVLFTVGWLWATAYWYLDDIARAGLWLYEPVPFSFVRYLLFCRGDNAVAPVVSPLGSNHAGHAALRWYADDLAYWHHGEHWWQSGLAL